MGISNGGNPMTQIENIALTVVAVVTALGVFIASTPVIA